jgi:RHS repeat-associated protein
LQCGVGEVCIDCSKMDSLYNLYLVNYAAFKPKLPASESDTLSDAQIRYNQLFENFMNNRLGFAMSAEEYLAFMKTCNLSTTGDSVSFYASCSSLDSLVNEFTCDYNSLSDSTVHTGQCGQKYWRIFSCNGWDQNATYYNSNNLSDFVVSDSLRFPTSIDTLPFGWIYYDLKRPICISNEFAVEFKIKNPIRNPDNSVTGGGDVGLSFNVDALNSPGYYGDNLYFDFTPGCACGFYEYRGIRYNDNAFNTVSFETWRKVKMVCKPEKYAIYVDGQLIKEVPRDGNSYFSSFKGLSIPIWGSKLRSIDSLIIYDSNNDIAYIEDFVGPAQMSKPEVSSLCAKPDCRDAFTKLFNDRYSTSFNFIQISKIYKQNGCNLSNNFTVCSESNYPMLCGKQTVYPTVPFTEVNNCTDSTFFIISNATELYKLYLDSINRVFDSAYMAKCLAAINYESFTVSHSVTEFHYTLYYYDQAGNLVKTVPPRGVQATNRSTWLDSVKVNRAASTALVPPHTLFTQYRYNTLNQVISQKSPDGGESKFYYDKLGRLALSQNAKQQPANQYSYTTYDPLGRIMEVGQLTTGSTITWQTVRTTDNFVNNLVQANSLEQITKTVYDEAYTPIGLAMEAKNLRNRVSYTATYSNKTNRNNEAHEAATFYSYDIHGNVDTLIQDFRVGMMYDVGHRFKKVVYRYDLISGKVNHVAYQPNMPDGFYHKYEYDAENRLTDVFTSRDSVYWERDANYSYYRHGPLARLKLGEQFVQGVDYAYTLQGWLKGVNSTALNYEYEMGRDGEKGTDAPKDVFGFSLNYHHNDYVHINNGNINIPFTNVTDPMDYKALYNGNIAAMAVNIGKFDHALVNYYAYDQLNRLVQRKVYRNIDNKNEYSKEDITDFYEDFSYDANGNILTANRNGAPNYGTSENMDIMRYNISTTNNQLLNIEDDVEENEFPNDIDHQDETNNYQYDAIGNLIYDGAEGINNIVWTVYGKIEKIEKNNGEILYTYDAAGNRISKVLSGDIGYKTEWYVRDAQGNVLSIYKFDESLGEQAFSQAEVPIYGSSRLGVDKINRHPDVWPESFDVPLLGDVQVYAYERGKRLYELSNHLGNVLATISDKKFYNANEDIYEADVVNAQDYYSFGMLMPTRTWDNGSKYRYGFNGKENDNEVKIDANGNEIQGGQQDYGMRIYDPRIGRFLSVDPKGSAYPMFTPYSFAANKPIMGIDYKGNVFVKVIQQLKTESGNTTVITDRDVWVYTAEELIMGLIRTPVQIILHTKQATEVEDLSDGVYWFKPITLLSGWASKGGLDKLEASLDHPDLSTVEKWAVKGIIEFGEKTGINDIHISISGEDFKGNKYGTRSRLLHATEGVKQFLSLMSGTLTDFGKDQAKEFIRDKLAEIISTTIKNSFNTNETITDKTVEVLKGTFFSIIDNYGKQGSEAILEGLLILIQTQNGLSTLQQYIDANKGNLPMNTEEAVQQQVNESIEGKKLTTPDPPPVILPPAKAKS